MGVRRVIAIVLLGVALVIGAVGVGLLVWAFNRDYADNQRNWGYMLGFAGLIGGFFTALLASIVGETTPDSEDRSSSA